ncbi:hypothetical protein [Spiroplasma endosymbiont of Apeira syringaria]|uniref:hypothetical protein n=1 Tax=Spiroplasma endosymbiont of Apeira syringaria TaxID=3066307 RepID=UPI0030D2DE13
MWGEVRNKNIKPEKNKIVIIFSSIFSYHYYHLFFLIISLLYYCYKINKKILTLMWKIRIF